MPNFLKPIPDPFQRAGAPISASNLNNLADAVRVSCLVPGSYQSSTVFVQAPIIGGGATVASTPVRVTIVLIDDDILGIEEDTEAEISESDGEPLHLFAYKRRVVDLKYYRQATEDDPGFEEGDSDDPNPVKMILVTEEGEYGLEYSTVSVYYDDGKDFLVGEYDREDYPEFPENDPFPPEGLPEGFLKKRYRGIVIGDTLVTALCQLLPAPELPDESS